MLNLLHLPLWVYLLTGYIVLQVLTVGFHEKLLKELAHDDITRWTLALFGVGWIVLAVAVVAVLVGAIWQVFKFIGRNMRKFYGSTGDLANKLSASLDKTLKKLFS